MAISDQDLEASKVSFVASAEIMHQVVNGDENTSVAVQGGSIDSIRKLQKNIVGDYSGLAAAVQSVAANNTGDETGATIKTKLGVSVLSGSNTGDETAASIQAKLAGSNVNYVEQSQLTSAMAVKEDATNKVDNFNVVDNTKFPTVKAVKDLVDARLVGVLNDRGTYNVSNDGVPAAYPSSGGSGADGSIKKGDLWYIGITVEIPGDPAAIGGVEVSQGDSIRALVDNPGQTPANWAIQEGNLGFTPMSVGARNTPDGVVALSTDRKVMVPTTGGSIGAMLGTLSTGQSYDINLPAKTGTVALLSDIGIVPSKVAMAANNLDLSQGMVFTKTITGATTFTVSNVPASGTVATIILDLTNGGLGVITWWANVKWPNGTVPALTPNGRDKLGFITYDAGATWDGFILGRNLS